MTSLNPDNLDRFFSLWRRELKHAEDVLLGPELLVNVVRAAIGDLDQRFHVRPSDGVVRNPEGDWDSRLLTLLERYFETSDPTIELLREEHPEPTEELTRLLSEGERYDVSGIYPLLRQIEDSPSAQSVGNGLTRELMGDGSPSRLLAFVRLLLRHALRTQGPQNLKDLPRRALARSYAGSLLGPVLGHLARDEDLHARARRVWQEYVGRASEHADNASDGSPPAVSGDDVSPEDGAWWALDYGFLEEAASAWAGRLDASDGGNTSDVPRTVEDAGKLVELGRDIARIYARALARKRLEAGSSGLSWEERYGGTTGKLGRGAHGELAATGVFSEGTRGYGERSSDVAERVAAIAVRTASIRHLSSEAADRIAEEVPEDELRRAAELLQGHVEDDGAHVPSEAQEDVEEACREVLARRRVQQDLEVVLSRITERLPDLLRAPSDDEGARTRFWSRWGEAFSRGFGPFDYLPWERASEEEVRRAVSCLTQQIDGPPRPWRVVFRVGGFDPEGAAWRTGAASFFDPDLYDFGQGRFERWEAATNDPFVLARVDVEAGGAVAAERTAQRALRAALDLLALTFCSPGRAVGALKPELLSGVYAAAEDGNKRCYFPGSSGSRSARPVGAIERDVEGRGERFGQLLAWARGQEREERSWPGEIRPGFLRAVRWYARGYWEPDSTQRLLSHWIGLEHLFVDRGESKKAVVNEVPKLLISWRRLRGLTFTGMTLHEIVRRGEENARLKELADSQPELAGWAEDVGVLLNPARAKLFALLATREDPQLALTTRRHEEELRAFAREHEGISGDVEADRWRESFKIVLLNGARNRIVHEAEADDPDAEAYADKAEAVLYEVLRTLADDATETEPEAEMVKELAEKLAQQPWLAAAEGMPVTPEGRERLRGAKATIMGERTLGVGSELLIEEARGARFTERLQ